MRMRHFFERHKFVTLQVIRCARVSSNLLELSAVPSPHNSTAAKAAFAPLAVMWPRQDLQGFALVRLRNCMHDACQEKCRCLERCRYLERCEWHATHCGTGLG